VDLSRKAYILGELRGKIEIFSPHSLFYQKFADGIGNFLTPPTFNPWHQWQISLSPYA